MQTSSAPEVLSRRRTSPPSVNTSHIFAWEQGLTLPVEGNHIETRAGDAGQWPHTSFAVTSSTQGTGRQAGSSRGAKRAQRPGFSPWASVYSGHLICDSWFSLLRDRCPFIRCLGSRCGWHSEATQRNGTSGKGCKNPQDAFLCPTLFPLRHSSSISAAKPSQVSSLGLKTCPSASVRADLLRAGLQEVPQDASCHFQFPDGNGQLGMGGMRGRPFTAYPPCCTLHKLTTGSRLIYSLSIPNLRGHACDVRVLIGQCPCPPTGRPRPPTGRPCPSTGCP